MAANLQKFLAILVLSFLTVLVARAWSEPDTDPDGGVKAPLVSRYNHQAKAGILSVADIYVKAYRNFDDGRYNRWYRGMFLSDIIQQPGLDNVTVTVRESPRLSADPSPDANFRGIDKVFAAEVQCEPGEILVMCSGSRNFYPPRLMSDSCSEQDCGLIGVEPIDRAGLNRVGLNPNEVDFVGPATGCRTLVYWRESAGGVRPHVKATCLKKAFRFSDVPW